jgi:signal transduction histidine kinase
VNAKPLSVLVIDDDAECVEMIRLCLDESDAMELRFRLDSAARLAEGLTKLLSSRYDVVILALTLPEARGLEAARAVLGAAPETAVLVSARTGDEKTALEAVRLGAQDFMIKESSDSRLLKRTVRHAVERKSALAQRDRLKAELAERRRLDELKDRWIDALAHDLLTPLTIVKGAIHVLDEERAASANSEQAELLRMARRQTERIERIAVRILEHSRLEAGGAGLAARPVDAAALIARVVEDFRRPAAARALALEVDCVPGLPSLSADQELLEQMVVNLLDNALRFAHARVVVRAAAAGDAHLELTVADDGLGIPPERKELLFTRFCRVARGGSRDGHKGPGLGLAICKEIVDLHRGRIEAESAPGRGTSFVVRLPLTGPAFLPRAKA